MRTQGSCFSRLVSDWAVWILVMLLASFGRATGQTNQFYVAADEKGTSDENDGTRAVCQGDKVGPWRTIRRALQAAQPGDTIFVGSGRYTEEVSITTPRIHDSTHLICTRGQSADQEPRIVVMTDIGDQDDLFDWMWSEFPGMFYVLAQAPPGQDTRLGVYRYGCPRTLAERRYT